LFDGKRDLKLCVSKISNLFEVSNEEAFNFIKPFLQNKKRVGIEYEGDFLEFPENILIENTNNEFPFRKFNYKDYIIDEELDLYTQRLFMGPSTVSLLVNTECATDCIYCYVDRSIKTGCKIPIERIKELVREAKEIGVVKFDIGGAEIFMYKHWEELIIELLKNDYYPYLSTKLPISEKIIIKLKSIGINDIQISIDSLDADEIKIVDKVKREIIILRRCSVRCQI
ncbi:MAG TPA: radical SAM protein, partial [Bacteroidia bacterium]|nr:radical SAM protein [Bacteroidia bacterium]